VLDIPFFLQVFAGREQEKLLGMMNLVNPMKQEVERGKASMQ